MNEAPMTVSAPPLRMTHRVMTRPRGSYLGENTDVRPEGKRYETAHRPLSGSHCLSLPSSVLSTDLISIYGRAASSGASPERIN